MPTSDDDPWGLRSALTGDETSWKVIVEEFAPSIWYWARSYDLSREEAEDVAQTVWYKLKDKGHTIRNPASLPGWLASTTKREAISTSRRRSRVRLIDQDFMSIVEDPRPSAPDFAEADELRGRLMESYHGLKASCKELLTLCWSGLSYEDIALTLDRPVGFVGPTRKRCLETLRARAGLS